MTTIIIEDEKPAARLLQRKLEKLNIEVGAMLHSVEESIEWFSENEHPDLIFLDIQLSDGLSFEIFEKIDIKSAVIFTTAFDEYALKAFKLNSIDYLNGGLGNDLYIIDRFVNIPIIVENVNEGTDTILGGFQTYTLGANIENYVQDSNFTIDGVPQTISIYGNTLNNIIISNTINISVVDTLFNGLYFLKVFSNPPFAIYILTYYNNFLRTFLFCAYCSSFIWSIIY